MDLKQKIINFVSQAPKKSLLIVGVILLVLSPGLLNINFDFGVKVWFRTTDPLLQNYEEFLKTFGNDDSITVSMKRKDGKDIFQPETIEDIKTLSDSFWTISNVVRVESLANFVITHGSEEDVLIEEFLNEQAGDKSPNEIKDLALNHEQMPGFIVSRDGQSALFHLRLKPLFDQQPDYQPVMAGLEKSLSDYEKKGYEFHLLGTAIVTDTFKQIAISDLLVMIPVLNIAIFLILLTLFRHWVPVAIPFIVTGCTAMATMALSGFLGIKLNNLSGMVPNILMAIAIADSVHIITTYLRAPRDGKRSTFSLKKNLRPTWLTSITTALGFFSLVSSDLVPIQNFGLLCGIGSLFAWVFSILIVTPLLDYWSPNLTIANQSSEFLQKPFAALLWFTDRPKKVIILTVVLLVSAGFIGSKNSVDSNPFNYFSKSTRIFQDNQFFLNEIGGVNGLEVIIDSQESNGIHSPGFQKKVNSLVSWLREQSYVNVVYSVLGPMKQINRSLKGGNASEYKLPAQREQSSQQYLFYTLNLPSGSDPNNLVDMDQRLLRVRVLWNIQNSKKSIAETLRIENHAKSLGLSAYTTGQEYLFQGMNDYVVKSYFSSIFLSILGVSLLLTFVFGSIKLGLLSLIPNLMPITFGAAIMYLVGKPIDVGTVLVGSVCFGIAVDDTIHFLDTYIESNNKGLKGKELYRTIFESTGTAIVFTTLTLVLGFSVFAFADFIPNLNFGVLSAFVLFMALVADLIILPALLTLFPAKTSK